MPGSQHRQSTFPRPRYPSARLSEHTHTHTHKHTHTHTRARAHARTHTHTVIHVLKGAMADKPCRGNKTCRGDQTCRNRTNHERPPTGTSSALCVAYHNFQHVTEPISDGPPSSNTNLYFYDRPVTIKNKDERTVNSGNEHFPSLNKLWSPIRGYTPSTHRPGTHALETEPTV